MRAVKSVSIDSERRVIITFLDGSTETLYPNCIWCDAEALKEIIKELLEEKADAVVQTINNVTIASFADGADEALIRKLLVSIDPIQEGEGDPSPENIRPISGRSGLSAWRTGKNLLNLSSITIPTTALPLYVPIFVGENAVTLSSSAPTNTAGNANLFLLPGSVSSGASASTNGVSVGMPRTVNAVDGYVTVAVRNHMGVNPIEYNNQLEIGSTASNYEPYKGTEVSVNWVSEAGTVYGGVLDLVSGKLTVDSGIKVFNGTEKWINYSPFNGYYTYLTPMKQGTRQDGSCNMLKLSKSTSSGQTNALWLGVGTKYVYVIGVYDSMGSTLNDFKSYLSEHNLEVVYPLGTTIEIQLTPQEITTLLGTNNIWADSGDILELEYVADTKLYIGESQSGTLGSSRQTISKPDLQPISDKTVEDIPEIEEKETHGETEDERGE